MPTDNERKKAARKIMRKSRLKRDQEIFGLFSRDDTTKKSRTIKRAKAKPVKKRKIKRIVRGPEQ